MIITLKKTTEEQVEITFPCYRKWNHLYYKVISEICTVTVTNSETGSPGIDVYGAVAPYAFTEDSEAITGEQFDGAYAETLAKLAEITCGIKKD